MLEIAYIYAVILGLIYVFRILYNDPERDKIWGTGKNESPLTHKEKELKTLKAPIDHYKNYRPVIENEPSREESMV